MTHGAHKPSPPERSALFLLKLTGVLFLLLGLGLGMLAGYYCLFYVAHLGELGSTHPASPLVAAVAFGVTGVALTFGDRLLFARPPYVAVGSCLRK